MGAKKGGAVYEVADAKDKKHLVYAKNMHAVYPSDPMTKPGTPPAEVLDDLVRVGVDVRVRIRVKVREGLGPGSGSGGRRAPGQGGARRPPLPRACCP